MLYTQLKDSVGSCDNSKATFLCGLFAGLLASLATQPFDVLKTNVQLHNSSAAGYLSTSVAIFQRRGIRSFFAGMAPRVMRRSLMSALSWTLFESLTSK